MGMVYQSIIVIINVINLGRGSDPRAPIEKNPFEHETKGEKDKIRVLGGQNIPNSPPHFPALPLAA